MEKQNTILIIGIIAVVLLLSISSTSKVSGQSYDIQGESFSISDFGFLTQKDLLIFGASVTCWDCESSQCVSTIVLGITASCSGYDYSSESACLSDGCEWECTPGADKCSGTSYYTCGSDGQWDYEGKVKGECGVECTSDSQCGTDRWIGDNFCYNNNVYREYRTYDCYSYTCDYDDDDEKVEDCTYSCLNGVCQGQPVICNEGDEKCIGIITYLCSGNTWVSQGEITGKCGVTCIEDDIILVADVYNICHDGVYNPILDVLELSEAEQAALMETINQLELTIEQKAQIIQNLTTTLEGQLVMIEQLEILTAEKAAIIIQLELNINQQAELISKMELTVAEQAQIVEALDLTIQEQAELINQMTINLAAKAALIQALQVENEQQAQLIAEMKLSFDEQAAIISALENLIGDDVVIILALYDTIDEQAALIAELELTKNELAELVVAMGLTIEENADLIVQLRLTTEEQQVIIDALELSLEDEKELMERLEAKIAEQNALIAQLQSKPDFDLSKINLQQVWDENQTLILIIGGFLLFILLIGGNRRK